MRIQTIAFLPPAALITAFLFFLTSSIVSALEAKFSESLPIQIVEIIPHETDCQLLERRIAAVEVDLQYCEAFPGCLDSNNICPSQVRDDYLGEYQMLKAKMLHRCSGVPTYASRVSTECFEGSTSCGVGRCGLSGTPALNAPGMGETNTPGVFVF